MLIKTEIKRAMIKIQLKHIDFFKNRKARGFYRELKHDVLANYYGFNTNFAKNTTKVYN